MIAAIGPALVYMIGSRKLLFHRDDPETLPWHLNVSAVLTVVALFIGGIIHAIWHFFRCMLKLLRAAESDPK